MNKKQQAVGHGGGGGSDSPYCSFHPRWELVVGVCAHCLKDRLLLLLAANNNNGDVFNRPAHRRRSSSSISSISLPKVLALGSSFLQRIDSRHHHHHHHHADDRSCSDDDTTSVASLDDSSSFISIKFEDNGKATWDKASSTCGNCKASTAVVVAADHVKRGGGGVTRWRKQVVGRLLHLARWKRSAAKANNGMMDGGKTTTNKAARGWIRSLTTRTRRRAHADRPCSS